MNAPESFDGYINKILVEKLDFFVIMYLHHILINTENVGKSHINGVRLVLDQLRKHAFFANLKKSCFNENEIRFLEFEILSNCIVIEEKRFDAIKAWLEQESICDIQTFLEVANFYRDFI